MLYIYIIPYSTWVLYSSEAAEVLQYILFQQLILKEDRCADYNYNQKLYSSV